VRDTAGELDRRGGQHTVARSRIAQTQPQGARQAEFVICDKAIERTFAWFGRNRRLSRDFERLIQTSEMLLYAAMARITLRRLANKHQKIA
jgi:putative transposase